MRNAVVALILFLLFIPALPAAADAGFVLIAPVEGRVLRGFDDVGRFEAGHRGVDLATSRGDEVVAGAAGRVHFAGTVAGRPIVSIDHGNGWRTTYQPVRASVAEGDVVAAGDPIGRLASGHCTVVTCLHWGLTDGDRYADPLGYLATPGVRLLPHGAQPAAMPELAAASVPIVGGLPVAGRVSSGFGPRVHPITGVAKLHDGVDLAAPCGTPVRAFAAGTVVSAGYHGAYGFRVVLDHGDTRTAYAHLPRVEVDVGSAVAAGEVIGRVGSTGLSTGCHLHWMAWRGGRLVDPMTLVG